MCNYVLYPGALSSVGKNQGENGARGAGLKAGSLCYTRLTGRAFLIIPEQRLKRERARRWDLGSEPVDATAHAKVQGSE